VTAGAAAQRVDKWLYFARFFKTRALAAAVVEGGHLRVNGSRAAKPSHPVAPGDVLTFVQAGRVRVVRVRAAGARRGPAPEAQGLYEEIDNPAPGSGPDALTASGGGPETSSLSDRRRLD
jgi:ribosome-associated heat shock protein Hsp15